MLKLEQQTQHSGVSVLTDFDKFKIDQQNSTGKDWENLALFTTVSQETDHSFLTES